MTKTAKTQTADTAHAVLTINGAGDMTPEGRTAIAKWLRNQAHELVVEGDQYAAQFRVRYLTAGDEDGE